MPDTKITALTAIGANPIIPSTFPIPMVDLTDTSMAASGTTKKVTVNQILGAGGTATLASATITGDLTVDTSTLKVDSANNRVGIGVAVTGFGSTLTVSGDIEIVGGNKTLFNSAGFLQIGTSAANYVALQTNNTERYRIASDGVATWSNVGGVAGTAMTLNANGLGIGVTPSAWASNRKALQIGGLASAVLALNGTSNVSELFFNSFINTSASNLYAVNGRAGLIDFGSGGFGFSIDSGTQTAGAACNFTRAMTLESTGSLVLGAAAVATTATDGFLYIPGCAGTPTGTPTAKTGRVPLVVDTTNNKLYFYSGGAWVAAN